MNDKEVGMFQLFGITIGEIMFKRAQEVDSGFAIICLKCAGKTGAKISLGVAGEHASLVCTCGNGYVEL